MAPAAVVDRLPPTVVVPKLVAAAFVIRLLLDPLTARLPPAVRMALPPVVSAAVKAFVSVSAMLPPLAVTVPVKSLPTEVRLTAPVPPATLLVPPARMLPPICEMPPVLLARVKVPVAVMSLFNVNPLAPVSETLLPLRLPWVIRLVPEDSVRFPLPVSMAVIVGASVSWPPATSDTSLFDALVNPTMSSAVASVIRTAWPLAVTGPVKSLPTSVRARSPAPASSVTAPPPAACTMAPVWLIPVAVSVNAPLPIVDVPSTNAFASLTATSFAPLLLRLTAPMKSLPASVSVIAPLPALKLDVPATVKAPPCAMPPVVVVTASPPLPMFNALALKVPLFVARLARAPLAPLPSAPVSVTAPVPALMVRARLVAVALSTVLPKDTAPLMVASVTSVPNVTASL